LKGSKPISQVSDLLQNEQRLNQALQSDQLTESQKNYYSGLRPIRKHLTSFSTSNWYTITSRPSSEADSSRREQAEQQAKQEAWQSGLRIGITSLLLSIGYIAIGWTGLALVLYYQAGVT